MAERTLTGAIAKGALAGALATWTMGRVTSFLYEREDRTARRREQQARGGRTSYEVAAEKLARATGRHPAPETRKRMGSAIHWSLGIGAGAVYAVLRERYGAVERGQGLGFGTAFWLLVDEMLTPAARLTPGPGEFPWQTHARGLAGHLAYGLTAETTLDLLDRAA